MDYRDYNDYELVEFIYEGNEEANNIILEKYTPMINNLASKMIKHCNNNGIDYNDLCQEGYIGLNYAINHFNEEKNTVFYTYVKKCIERKMISTLIASNRLKHRFLNESISFDNDNNILDKTLKDELNNPEFIIENIELEENLIKNVKKKLTDYEEQVFELLISDFNYKEISDILDKDKKGIDNTIQRIRNKFKEELNKLQKE